MATVDEYAEAAAQVWGLLLLGVLVIGVLYGTVFWAARGLRALRRRRRVMRVRELLRQEAITEVRLQLERERLVAEARRSGKRIQSHLAEVAAAQRARRSQVEQHADVTRLRR